MLHQHISDLEQHIETLQADNDRLRMMADFAYDWEYWLTPGGIVLYISPACERITGYRTTEFQADPELLERIIHPDDRDWMAHHLRDEQRRRQAYELQFRIITRSGEQRWIGHACQPVYSAAGDWLGQRASNRDITERMRAEEALYLTNQQLEQLFSTMHIAVAYMNRTFTFLRVNQAYAAADNQEPAFFVGKNHFDLYPDAENETIFRRVVETRETYTTYARPFVYPLNPERGTTYWDWSLYPVIGDNGEVDGLVFCLSNVTERVRIEKELHTQHLLTTALSAINNKSDGLALVLDTVLQLEGVDCGGVYLVNQQTGSLDLMVHRGLSEHFIASVAHIDSAAPQAMLVQTGLPIYQPYALFDFLPEERRQEGLCIIAVIPIMHQNQVIAVLNLGSHAVDELAPHTRTLLEAIAAQIGATIVRITTETALHDSQHNLQTLFNSLDDLLFIARLDGKLLHTNPAVEQRLGYTQSELRSKYVLDMHPPERHDEAIAVFTAMVEGRQNICPVPLITKAGQLIPVETRIVPGVWDGQEVLFGISRDISERIHMEAALRESQLLLQAVIDNAPVSILVKDRQGRYLLVNRRTAANQQLEPHQMIGKSQYDLFPAAFVHTVHQSDQHVWDTGQTVEIEEVLQLPIDGNLHTLLTIKFPLLNVQGEMYAIGAVITDITARKQMEEDLRENKERYRSVIAAMHEGIVLQNSDGVIVACNASAEYILGLPQDQMMGRTSNDECWHALHEDGSPFSGDMHPAIVTLRTGVAQSNVIMGLPKADNTLTWISINAQPLLRPDDPRPYAVVTSFNDITERKRTADALREKQAQLQAIFDNAAVGIFLITTDGHWLDLNRRGMQMLGYSRDELARMTYLDILHPTERTTNQYQFEKMRWHEQISYRMERRYRRKDGTVFWGDLSITAIHNTQGNVTALLGVLVNITWSKESEDALQRAVEQLRQISIRDPLTGLFNRRYLDETLPRELQRAVRQHQSVGVIMLDIDHFKQCNDTYGHDAGDTVLQAVGRFLQDHTRGADLVCRYGGEEFILILPGATLDHTRQRAEEIRLSIKGLSVCHQNQILPPVTMSLGVAVFPTHGTTATSLITIADQLLYQAKHTGRDRVVTGG